MSFNKFPSIKINPEFDRCLIGWKSICAGLNQQLINKNQDEQIVIECYQGCHIEEIISIFSAFFPDVHIQDSADFMKSEAEIRKMTQADVTNHRVFGKITQLAMLDFFDLNKVEIAKNKIAKASGVTFVIGVGASLLVNKPSLTIYADMARWEIQQRMRRNEVDNIGISNRNKSIEKQYKRGYFVDWRVCDELKKNLLPHVDFVLDTNNQKEPKLASGNAIRNVLEQATKQPFSVVPYFDAGPWGGQWMKEKFDLDSNSTNYAWSFNCVPEENSLLIEFSNTKFEIPSVNIVYYKPIELLGPAIYREFGAEFPIRFDFLDTMEGGSLSLQVHPLKEYIKEEFNMPYTQDESYYMLDAGKDAIVYLGMTKDVNPDEMIDDLKLAQTKGQTLNAEKYSKKWSAKKHDHFLIPAGTVHCSGKDCMVLEISATPYIFTFKLWDWGRLGMDGRPRPIAIEHGAKVIQWDRDPQWTKNNLINQFEEVNSGEGWMEEKTGLHELEFIETRRFWFDTKVNHDTKNNLNVLMLIEGNQAVVESPDNSFKPFIINYAEAFIVPASIGKYTISPTQIKKGEKIAIIKAFVKTNQI